MSDTIASTTEKPRRPLRPLYGIPERDPRDHIGLLVSTAFHALIILAMLLPPFLATQLDLPLTQGGGGPGPAGGGGGGAGGETLVPERVRFLQVTRPPPTPSLVPPLVTPPKPEPVPVPKVEPPAPVPPLPAERKEVASADPAILLSGAGRGSGNDGTAGNGPGSGGGLGSGVGTGSGSGLGPGTGGGPGDIYPPQVTNLALLPIPVPHKVRPYKMVAWFDVDELGNAKLIAFNPSRDGSYNRKVRDMLAEVRFRPAVRKDGTPVRDTVSITAHAPN